MGNFDNLPPIAHPAHHNRDRPALNFCGSRFDVGNPLHLPPRVPEQTHHGFAEPRPDHTHPGLVKRVPGWRCRGHTRSPAIDSPSVRSRARKYQHRTLKSCKPGVCTRPLRAFALTAARDRAFPGSRNDTIRGFIHARRRIASQRQSTNQLTAKGRTKVASGGDASISAVASARTEQTLETWYGGGFGGGWYHRGWWVAGGPGFATVERTPVGAIHIDIFDSQSKKLIWHGVCSDTLTAKPGKNEKKLEKDLADVFRKFPPAEKDWGWLPPFYSSPCFCIL